MLKQKNYIIEIKIPENINVSKQNNTLFFSGPLGSTAINLEKIDPLGSSAILIDKKKFICKNSNFVKTLFWINKKNYFK